MQNQRNETLLSPIHPDDKWPESIDMDKLVKLHNMMLRMISSMANN